MEGCTCWYSIHQPLTAFSEISTHVLEIANLSVDPTPTRDSHDQDWTGAACWVIMCMQLSWHVTERFRKSITGQPTLRVNFETGKPETLIALRNSTGISSDSCSLMMAESADW